MSFMDNLKKDLVTAFTESKNVVEGVVNEHIIKNAGEKKDYEVVFETLPSSVEEFKSLPQMSLDSPVYAPALFVLAMTFYTENRENAIEMINAIKGPRPLSGVEIQFIRDRMMDGDYVPRSYFEGTNPENNYTPKEPYTVKVTENMYTYAEEGYAKLLLHSSGADSPRQFVVRKKEDKWYMWDQFLLAGIRKPVEEEVW